MFEIVHLEFAPNTHQPQDLFNRLPKYCAVQKLTIFNLPPDIRFLFRFKNAICLSLPAFSPDLKIIRDLFEELPFLSDFTFECKNRVVTIQTGPSKVFEISFNGSKTIVSDVNAAIRHLLIFLWWSDWWFMWSHLSFVDFHFPCSLSMLSLLSSVPR